MMKFIFLLFLFTTYWGVSQSERVELKSKEKTTLDVANARIEISLPNRFQDSLIVYNKDSIVAILTSSNKPSSIEVMEGYCYCNSCVEVRRSRFQIAVGETTYLKWTGRESVVLEYEIKQQISKPKSESRKALDDVVIKELEPGKLIELDEIFFVGGSTVIIPQSLPQLNRLVEVMKDNPKLEIQIEGHVNGLFKDTVFYNYLAEGRALAIREYLMQAGVVSSRVKAIGHGNRRMLFPEPVTEEQMQKNRRVEIRVISI